jgi:hypothetical protein
MNDDGSCPEDIDDDNDPVRKKVMRRRWQKLNIDMHREKLPHLSA